MISTTLLATCGLIFAVAAANPEVGAEDRKFYDRSLDHISHLIAVQNSILEVRVLIDRLGAAAREDPASWNRLVDEASPGCLALVGREG